MKHMKVAGIVLALALVALFVPFLPATVSSGQFLGVHYQQTATESPAFYAFHCGAYMNAQVSAQLPPNFSGFYKLSKGYSFACNYNSG